MHNGKSQTLHRHLTGFRHLLEKLEKFARQYFFATDREELPFNGAQPSWVYRAAKVGDNTVAFGSGRNISTPARPASRPTTQSYKKACTPLPRHKVSPTT